MPLRRPDEQTPLLREGQAKQGRRIWTSTPVLTLFVILYIALSVLIYSTLVWIWPDISPIIGARPRHGSAEIRYPGEKIKWTPCGEVGNRTVECSSIDVPMDQFNASNSGDKTFYVPLIRLRGRNATQNILLNPGGPGGSGTQFMHRFGESLSEIVGDGFHLLSFDPRGINASRPLALCYPDAETRKKLRSVHDINSEVDTGEVYAWSENYVRACAETTGEHGAYINTPQTAADMNSILDAVGQSDMIYWGFSYGTLLGQTYATMYPERSTRVIIDGVANHFEWYEEKIDREAYFDSGNIFAGLLDECWRAEHNCSLAPLGSRTEVGEKLHQLIEGLRTEPLNVYINSTSYGLLTYHDVWLKGVFRALYKPASWYQLADNLAALLQGNATAAFLAYHDDGTVATNTSDAMAFVTLNDGASGPEHWKGGRQELLDILTPYIDEFAFSDNEWPTYFAKQRWRIPKTHTYVPRRGVQTAHPLLVLSTTFDPICPLVSARSALSAFEGSRLVEVKGYGHCSIAMPSLCVARHVRAFFYNGTLPEQDVQCEVDGPYFVKPEDGKLAVAFAALEDLEEQRIHQAQVTLARDSWF
ncbi:alpha/beta-hydrolase [Thozetella sp. PMI_491]|nr:alpha/beta-hydrolase [Thozetella sp. PMI_491]